MSEGSQQAFNKWQCMSILIKQLPKEPRDFAKEFRRLFFLRLISENLLAFLLQYMGLMLSTLIPAIAPIWLATGTACGFIFLRGPSILPGIWLGSFIAYSLANFSAFAACSFASIYMLQAFLLFYICHRYIHPTLIFYRYYTLIKFFIVSMLIALFFSSVIYLISHHYFHLWPWLIDGLANWNGMLIVAMAIVTVDAYFPEYTHYQFKHLFFYSLIGVLAFIFALTANLFFIFLALPIILLMSIYFGRGGVSFSLFILSFILALAAYLQVPWFLNMTSVFYLQCSLIIVNIIGLLIALKQCTITRNASRRSHRNDLLSN